MNLLRKLSSRLMLALAIALVFSLPARAQDAPPAPKIKRATTESYADILRKVKATDSGVDYREFRLAYADSADYQPSAAPEARKAMFAALSAKDFASAAKIAEAKIGRAHV